MHEFSIATGIVSSVSDFAEAHPDVVIVKVRVAVGELTCVNAEQLSFCYESITKDSTLEGSELEIERLPAAVRCRSCNYSGPPKFLEGELAGVAIPTLQCPQCGGAAEATCGHECQIKSVQVLNRGECAENKSNPAPGQPTLQA